MLEMNLDRLINASPFSDSLPDSVINALLYYLIETGVKLETLNIDNIIVNCISALNKYEYERLKDYVVLLCIDDEYYYVLN